MKFQWPVKLKKSKQRKYEGAAKSSRTSGWITGSGDANAMINHDLAWLRERSRYLRRNNPYAHKGIEVITNNVIGKGITTVIGNDKNDTFQNKWKDWTQSTACDWDGRHDLRGLQRIAMDAVVESGEVLIRQRFSNDPKAPIKYQILESDFLNNTLTNSQLENGNTIIQGIEFDKAGRRVAYHLYRSHPGSIDITASINTVRVDERDIYHLYRQDRPGQIRGVPWLSPVMIRLKDLDGFEDATLMRQKIANLFVAFVSDINDNVECEDDSDLGERMTPAMIEHLPPGKTIEFANPPEPQNYSEFVGAQLRAISAGLGISYETMANDLSQVNFSSARMGWIEMGRNIESWRQHIIINPFMKKVEKDFIFMCKILGTDASQITFDHVPPKRELIDPTKEIDAMISSVRAGFDSRESALQSLGKDPKRVNEQIKKGNEEDDKQGFVFDTDPRKVTSQGQKHMEPVNGQK